MNNKITRDSNILLFLCPHCNEQIIVLFHEVNCKIFRHGIMKSNYEQINPHASKEICDKLIERNEIYGCGKPFRITNDFEKVEKCDYI